MIAFDRQVHNFGDVLQGTDLTTTFQYTGTTPILLGHVVTNCSCTSKSFDPGTGVLTLSLSSAEIGFKQSVVTIGDVNLILQANVLHA